VFKRDFNHQLSISETFEKCQFLFKFKKGENFNHPGTICRTYPGETTAAKVSQGRRGRQEYIEYFEDNPPKSGGGLEFEPDPKE
jgi:hypothetical protein